MAQHTRPVTVLVTGATDGIGRQTAVDLARQGVRVLVHGRDPERVEAAVRATAHAAGEDALLPPGGVLADLASLDAVRGLPEQVAALTSHLDGVVHNAGVFLRERSLTADGLETTFAVNHLAPYLLTYGLRGLLLASGTSERPARVVTVSSVAHVRGRIHWDDLGLERGWDPPGLGRPGYPAYAQSKLGNVLFAYALARRWRDERVTSVAVSPGVINTKLLRAGFAVSGGPVEQGARTSVWAAAAPEMTGVTGVYLEDSAVVESSPASHDQGDQERLWRLSADLAGVDWP